MPDNPFDFESVAARYDLWYETPLGRAYDHYEKKAASRLLPPAGPGGTLFEAGSGTGHWSSWFSMQGYSVTGIDISKKMTQIAESKKINTARFLTGDFLKEQIDERYDVVAAMTSLEFMAEPEKAVEKMRRLVKPGGCLFIGLLNRWSVLGLSRRLTRRKKITYRKAYFFSMGEIKRILGQYGKPEIASAAFLPPCEALLVFSGAFEKAGSALFPRAGNFIVCRVFL